MIAMLTINPSSTVARRSKLQPRPIVGFEDELSRVTLFMSQRETFQNR
jgi:hypothetical protein